MIYYFFIWVGERVCFKLVSLALPLNEDTTSHQNECRQNNNKIVAIYECVIKGSSAKMP